MAFLRYGKRMPMVATECGYWNADVLGVDDQKSIEIEIKKSRADFLNDFRSKERKHSAYANLKADGRAIWSPNFFYYFTYSDLGESCLRTLDEFKINHAGLAVLDRPSTKTYSAGRSVSILRKAPRLHNNKPHPKLVRAIQLRMGSEITTLRLKLELLKNAAPEQIAAIIKEASELALQLTERPDWENEEATAGQNQLGPESV